MDKKDFITIQNTKGIKKDIPMGSTLLSALEALGDIDKSRILLAGKINNIDAGLEYFLPISCTIEPIYMDSESGTKIYRNTFCFVLAMAAKELFPDRNLIIGNTIMGNFTFYFKDIMDVAIEDLEALDKKLKEIIAADIPIIQDTVSYKEAEKLFIKEKQHGASLLLMTSNEPLINISRCNNYSDLTHSCLCRSTGCLKYYRLLSYYGGFVIQLPLEGTIDKFSIFKDIPVLATIFQEYRKRGQCLHFSNVGELNQLIEQKKEKEIILMCEMLQNNKIANIANQIYNRKDMVKVVLIAGPSSSGKTTFIKKLSIQLELLGLSPISLSFDDYYVPRLETPKDENGNYDYECPEAIDIELLNRDLLALFKGDEVNMPYYNFITGLREYHNNRIKMSENSILLMEGIHGLNDKLTHMIPKANKFKIYISALTQMNLDDHNKISTSDNRLLRRMVRDYRTRGCSATETISRWKAVKDGENKYIFPYQNDVDAAFNTALEYEFGVLKIYVSPLLKTVKPYQPEYRHARRLQQLLSNFITLRPDFIPKESILKEFIGGSIYKE